MKFWIASCFVAMLLLGVSSANAQDSKTEKEKNNKAPDFSGTWIYDESKSNKVFKSSQKTSAPTKKTSRTLVIEHSGIELKLMETVVVEVLEDTGKVVEKTETKLPSYTYYTDKRGEQNINASGEAVKSVTHLDKKQIRVSIADKKDYRHSTLTFSLSKDGQELKVVWISITSDDGHISYTGFGDRVYNKAK